MRNRGSITISYQRHQGALALAARGLPNTEIGRELGITSHSVGWHLNSHCKCARNHREGRVEVRDAAAATSRTGKS